MNGRRLGVRITRTLVFAALATLGAVALSEDPAPQAAPAPAWRIDDTHPAASLAISRDETIAVAGGEDGVARVYDVATRKLLRELKGHKGPIVATEFVGGDREWLATFSYGDRVRVWNPLTGTLRKELARESAQDKAGGPTGMAAAASGHVVVLGRSLKLSIWNGEGVARETALSHTFDPTGLALSRDGSRCAIVDEGLMEKRYGFVGGLSVCDLATGKASWACCEMPPTGTKEEIEGLHHLWTRWHWSPDGGRLLLVGSDPLTKADPRRLSDADVLTGPCNALLRCHEASAMAVQWTVKRENDRILDVAFAPGGTRAVVVMKSAAYDLDLATGELTAAPDLAADQYTCAAYGPKSVALYLSTAKGALVRVGGAK